MKLTQIENIREVKQKQI